MFLFARLFTHNIKFILIILYFVQLYSCLIELILILLLPHCLLLLSAAVIVEFPT